MPVVVPPSRFVHPLLHAGDWQARPEFIKLCTWWRNGGEGICALVGIGGAGKTAIAERFLRMVPGGLISQPNLADKTLPRPRSLFTFSFYEEPSADQFFAHLYSWLSRKPIETLPDTSLHRSAITLLEDLGQSDNCSSSPILLVLDGLERIQDDGLTATPFFQLLDERVQRLLLLASGGYLSGIAIIVTSRFTISDILTSSQSLYKQIDIDQIDGQMAVKLLRARGVIGGTDAELRNLATEYGLHALTVDLLGGYIGAFCGGDPFHFPGWDQIKVHDNDVAMAPRLASLREQERRFRRLTERYRVSMEAHDPVLLDLLQCVCLFRKGRSAETITRVFAARGGESGFGSALRFMNCGQIQQRLGILVQMRLVYETQLPPPAPSDKLPLEPIYTVHPAVRIGFLQLEESTSIQVGHKVVKEELLRMLGNWSPGETPTDPSILDDLEEIIFQAIEAGSLDEAWDLFWGRMGAWQNIVLRLGAFERGERIAREFGIRLGLGGKMTKRLQSDVIGLWAFCLKELGQLDRALSVCQRELMHELLQAEIYMLKGYLRRAIPLFRDGYKQTAGIRFAESHQALCEALIGRDNCVAREMHYQGNWFGDGAVCDWQCAPDIPALDAAQVLLLLGYRNEARRFAKMGMAAPRASATERCLGRMISADSDGPQRETEPANLEFEELERWALRTRAQAAECAIALVQVRRALAALSDTVDMGAESRSLSGETDDLRLDDVGNAIEHGIRLSRVCGYGILHIDFLIESARLRLLTDEPEKAIEDLRLALEVGVHPPAESGRPVLLAASDEECCYVWGIAECFHLRAKALLLQAAQILLRADFSPAEICDLPAQVRAHIESARRELEECLKIRRRIQDPRLQETERVLSDLDRGVLTKFPPSRMAATTADALSATGKEKVPTMVIDQVLISYSHRDSKFLKELLTHLRPLERAGRLTKWSDNQILPGSQWFKDIQEALARTKVAVLLVTPSFLASDFIHEHELGPLLNEAAKGGVLILWVPVRACAYKETPLKDYQAVISPDKPLAQMKAERDSAWVRICGEIMKAANP